MPRSIDGHGRVSASRPPPTSTLSPRSLRISAEMPGNGFVADPGFSVVAPGSGVIMIAPGSVCHHVSTTGQRSPPLPRERRNRAPAVLFPPPRVDDGTAPPADEAVVPDPCFRIDRLADRSEQ